MRNLRYNLCTGLVLLGLAACGKPASHGESGAGAPADAPKAVVKSVDFRNPMAGKPGLWQISTVVPEMKGPVDTSICIDATMGEKWLKMGGHISKDDVDCSKREIVRTATGAVIDQVCTVKGRTVTSHIDYTIISDSEFKETVHSTVSPATAGESDHTVDITGKWLGACPATMAPGDMEMNIPGLGKQVIKMHDMEAMAHMKKP